MNANGIELLRGREADDLKRTGFTVVELLVVVGCVCILAVTLLPALAAIRPNSRAFVCLANQRQLMTAWSMYARDNNGALVINGVAINPNDIHPNWVAGLEDYNGSEADTNTALLTNQNVSLLGPYLQSPAVFKCPTDLSCQFGLSGPPRVRSYSMNIAVGPGGVSGLDPHEKPGSGGTYDDWLPWPKYRVFLKESDLVAPEPSQLWVLTDEEPDSINDGCFAVLMASTPASTIWVDAPSKAHDGGGSFAFADGHAEIHRWQSSQTVVPVRYLTYVQGATLVGDQDLVWWAQHTPRNPKGP